MKAENLHLDKINLINWITRLEDISVLAKLKKIQNSNDEEFQVPQWQQDLVLDRIKNTKIEEYISIEELGKRIVLQR